MEVIHQNLRPTGEHKRSQDFVWGALFFFKKLTTFFIVPSKHTLKLPT